MKIEIDRHTLIDLMLCAASTSFCYELQAQQETNEGKKLNLQGTAVKWERIHEELKEQLNKSE